MPRQKKSSIEWFSTIRRIQSIEASLASTSTIFNLASLAGVSYLFFRCFTRGSLAGEAFTYSLFIGITLLMAFNMGQHFLVLFLRKKRQSLEEELFREGYKPVYHQDAFREVLRNEVKRAGRYHVPVSLCFIDLDEREKLYEKHGKGYGDKIHENFEKLVSTIIRASDYLCRLDNRQFCILLSHTNLAHAENFVYRLLLQSQERLELSFSSGLTSYRTGETPQMFIERGQKALFRAKHDGIKKTHCAIGKDDERVIKTF